MLGTVLNHIDHNTVLNVFIVFNTLLFFGKFKWMCLFVVRISMYCYCKCFTYQSLLSSTVYFTLYFLFFVCLFFYHLLHFHRIPIGNIIIVYKIIANIYKQSNWHLSFLVWNYKQVIGIFMSVAAYCFCFGYCDWHMFLL